MEKMTLKKSGNEQQPNAMNGKLNKTKIENFYQQIIRSYQDAIKELYWGSKDIFTDLIEQAEKSSNGEDIIIIICKNSEEIELSQLLFDFLFKGANSCEFNHSIGRRYKYEDYIFIELVESPIVSIEWKIEKIGVFPITEDVNKNIGSCFFIKSEEYGENYDYPKEVIPFFVSQMKNRLKTSKGSLLSNFLDHFEPQRYILKVKECEDNLLTKLLYRLSINLGVVENSILQNQEISVQQEMQSILDSENNINITNEPGENLDSLNFYISVIRNPNRYYRFLDAYHILESFFYKYFYNYVKNLSNNIKKAKLYNDIKEHTSEKQMLKLVIEDCLPMQEFRNIKNRLMKIRIQELAGRVGKNYDIEKWPVNNTGVFATKLADLIYTFRNAIVHSKESGRYIEKIEESPNLIIDFVKLTNILLEIVKCVLEGNVDRW